MALGQVEEVDGGPLVGADVAAVPRLAEDPTEVRGGVTDPAEVDAVLAVELGAGDDGEFPLGDLDEASGGTDGDLLTGRPRTVGSSCFATLNEGAETGNGDVIRRQLFEATVRP